MGKRDRKAMTKEIPKVKEELKMNELQTEIIPFAGKTRDELVEK